MITPVGNAKIKEFIEAFGVPYEGLRSFKLVIEPDSIVHIDCEYVVPVDDFTTAINVVKKQFNVIENV